jgi:hypothetical protein
MKANALIVVAKRPLPGSTKTRLCPPLTPDEAAELYRCLLLDTLALLGRLSTASRARQAARQEQVDCSIAYTPAHAVSYFRDLAPTGFRLVPQTGIDLGERLATALGYHLDLGYQRVAIMNSDGPTLPVAYLSEAFRRLENADVTLGPSEDGGYYLIGMKRLHRDLFRGVTWSTEHVRAETLDICRQLGLRVHLLPPWYDVDVAADLQRLHADLVQNPLAAQHTWEFLRSRSFS